MRYIQILASIIFLSSCASKDVTPESVRRLNSENYWNLVSVESFTDGGSVVHTFLNGEGEVIHIWTDGSFSSPDTRRFYLKSSYNDRNAIEVIEGSEFEQKLITLLESCNNYSCLPDNHSIESMCSTLKEIMQDRHLPNPYKPERQLIPVKNNNQKSIDNKLKKKVVEPGGGAYRENVR